MINPVADTISKNFAKMSYIREVTRIDKLLEVIISWQNSTN
jgi:hypothetical protein